MFAFGIGMGLAFGGTGDLEVPQDRVRRREKDLGRPRLWPVAIEMAAEQVEL
jgi:hypothetical protein